METRMISRKNTISRLLTAVGVTAILAVGAATPSLAAKVNRGYQTQAYDARAYYAWGYYDAWGYGARTRADARQRRGGGYFAHGAPDDPPGSAFQTFANDQEMGLVR
jgi:hypothetical protein